MLTEISFLNVFNIITYVHARRPQALLSVYLFFPFTMFKNRVTFHSSNPQAGGQHSDNKNGCLSRNKSRYKNLKNNTLTMVRH